MNSPAAPDASSGSPDAGNWSRLASDLVACEEPFPPPSALREQLLRRIQEEPARVETDREGRVIAVNPAFTSLCGYGFATLCGAKPGHLLQGPDSDPSAVALLREAVRRGIPCSTELINYHKDGSPYRVHIDLQPIHGESGSVTGFRATEIKIPL